MRFNHPPFQMNNSFPAQTERDIVGPSDSTMPRRNPATRFSHPPPQMNNSSAAQTNNTERDSSGPGDSTRGSPMRRRNPAACLHCRKRKIRVRSTPLLYVVAKDPLFQCNAGEVDVCDKCHALKKQCIILSVTCEDAIRSQQCDPENMPFDALRSLIQALVQSGKLNHSDAPHILSNYQTSNQPVHGVHVGHAPFLPIHLPSQSNQPNYNISMQPNSTPSQQMLNYSITHINQPPHVPNNYLSDIPLSDPRTTENTKALGAPVVNNYSLYDGSASFLVPPMRHGDYAAHLGQGSFPFVGQDQIGQANHLPYGDPIPRGYP
jgi:hypothetical protein